MLPFFKNSILHQSEELCRKAKIINGVNWTAAVSLSLLDREASESNSISFGQAGEQIQSYIALQESANEGAAISLWI